MTLSDSSLALVLHFGEMGSRWGFNRTVGQILALLTIHPDPLNADHLAEALHISRGNVSMGLKELQAWRLIERQHQPGDRKEYFTQAGSIWDMARIVFEERRKRELDPTLSLLRQQLLSANEDSKDDYTQAKMQEIHDLLEQLNTFANALHDMEPERLKLLMSMGTGASKVLSFFQDGTGGKKKSSPS
ncbi:GbsR/MarR family transcriptional regulator [Pseudomaricurvus sp.]|uniref:GbsR/MarR family transcriptional regulator n=1 Tax=Pseudomaricurvus sp. TaxID=2004510 RepID=UPI003F6C3075